VLFLFFINVEANSFTSFELVGNIFSVGIILGTYGINVGHELGHRLNWLEPFMARLLLLPCFYIHFQIDHNLGHHKMVGTPEDASSAPKGMSVYVFWIRSVFGSYRSAWNIESKRLDREGRSFWTIQNKMIQYTFAQIAYGCFVYFVFGAYVLALSFIVGMIGFLLLESVNYIEHYGLRRKLLPTGRYEPVGNQHSWNSDHEFGRIILYELTRHTDHHMKSQKRYQTLDYIEGSPQLPFGYPGSILMSFVPPLWFRHIHPILNKYQESV
jgi:alkane 1-monooxygenase